MFLEDALFRKNLHKRGTVQLGLTQPANPDSQGFEGASGVHFRNSPPNGGTVSVSE
jgi:hypothetical protein